jgi:hypothetical protein
MKLSQSNVGLGTGDSAEIATEPGCKTVVHTPAAATQATASVAALATGKHVCKGVSVSIACAGTAQTPIRAVLRDGATGAGTILWSKKLSAPVNGYASVDEVGLSLPGSLNTAMTLEFAGAGVAASEQDVTLIYFDLTEGLPR